MKAHAFEICVGLAVVVFLVLMGFLVSAENRNSQRWNDLAFETKKQSIDLCFKAGKLPVISEFSGRVVDCK